VFSTQLATLKEVVCFRSTKSNVESTLEVNSMNGPIKKKLAGFLAAALIALVAVGCDEEAPPYDDPAADQEEVEQETEVAEEAQPEEPAHAYADFHDDFAPLPPVPDSLDELPPGVNVVQFEMRLLTEGMQNILRLIADDRLDEIPDQIRQIHPAYELTHQAIEEGIYAPPVNSDQIDEFIAMDDEFHDDLRALVAASREGDLQGATDRYSDLVQGCTSCHGQFRFP
jgi:hypothetical protein